MALELTALEELSPAVERVAGAKAPPPMRLMAARGLAPLGPADLVTALYQLSFSEEGPVHEAARKTAVELPDKILGGALGEPLDPRVLDFFARRIFARPKLLETVLLNKRTADETYQHLASSCAESQLELIAKNEERLLRHPPIIAALYLNPKTRMSTAQRALELAVRNGVRVEGIPAFDEAAKAIAESGETSAEAAAAADAAFSQAASVAVDAAAPLQIIPLDPAEAEALGAAALEEADGEASEEVQAELQEKTEKLSELNPAAKIRLATLGNAFARSVLIRDTNKQVAMASIRSPGVSDGEALRYAGNRGLDEDVIRYIGNQRQWVRLYGVKVALCNNPKCPLPVAMRLLQHLNVRDLKMLSRSKGIPSALVNAAKQMLNARGA